MKYETSIIYNDLTLDVSGTYIAGEAEVLYHSDMSGTPASPSEFEISKVEINNWDITICLSDDDLTSISELIINEIESQ
jgi:hypothetical protein